MFSTVNLFIGSVDGAPRRFRDGAVVDPADRDLIVSGKLEPPVRRDPAGMSVGSAPRSGIGSGR